MTAPPDQVRAIVVGIHHYDYDSAWELRGPTDDALRMVDWLIGRGLTQDQIALFLSPASWQEKKVMQWVEKLTWTKPYSATQGGIKKFIDQELADLAGSALFFYWGGHGLVGSDSDQNYLLLADATKANTYFVNLQSLFITLKQEKFAHLTKQLCVIDACATPCDEIVSEIRLSEVNFTSGELEHNGIEQCYLFAASPGKQAQNDSSNCWGIFSRHFYSKLPPPSAPAAMDDFVSIFRDVRDKGELEVQRPCMIWLKGIGELEKSGYIPSISNAAARLLALIRQLQIEPRRCKRIYLRCLPNPTRTSPQDDLENWIRDLADVPWPKGDYPSPLVEFAFRVSVETGHVALEQWALQECKPEQLAHLRNRLADEEGGQKILYTTLFLELDDEGKHLRWWLWSEQRYLRTAPVIVHLTQQKLQESLKQVLPLVLREAYLRIAGGSDLRISLLLPFNQLPEGLENIELELELDGMSVTESLHQRYPLLLHWNRRANSGSSPSTHAKWKLTAEKLQRRIAQGSGTSIQWLDNTLVNPHEAAKNQLISGLQQAICVGLDGVTAQAAALAKSIQGCLQQGIPCFLWLQQKPADAAEARRELEHSLGAMPAADLPVELKRLIAEAKVSSALPAVRIVWDIPEYLPESNQLQPLLPGTQHDQT